MAGTFGEGDVFLSDGLGVVSVLSFLAQVLEDRLLHALHSSTMAGQISLYC